MTFFYFGTSLQKINKLHSIVCRDDTKTVTTSKDTHVNQMPTLNNKSVSKTVIYLGHVTKMHVSGSAMTHFFLLFPLIYLNNQISSNKISVMWLVGSAYILPLYICCKVYPLLLIYWYFKYQTDRNYKKWIINWSKESCISNQCYTMSYLVLLLFNPFICFLFFISFYIFYAPFF